MPIPSEEESPGDSIKAREAPALREEATPNEDEVFFRERQGAAVLKHGIIRAYLQPYFSKVGKFDPGREVHYLDGYAGPGNYADGTPGSPALAAETAKRIAGFRTIHCHYVEPKRKLFRRLESRLKDISHNANLYRGTIEHLENYLKDLGPQHLKDRRRLKTDPLRVLSGPKLYRCNQRTYPSACCTRS